jgi:hypothetical protein
MSFRTRLKSAWTILGEWSLRNCWRFVLALKRSAASRFHVCQASPCHLSRGGRNRAIQSVNAAFPGRERLAQLAVQSILLNWAIQLVSQVLPPSPEKACSQWAAVAVMPDQMKRTLMGLPRRVSLE